LVAVSAVTVRGLAAAETDPVTPPLVDVHLAVYFVTAAPLFAAAITVTESDPVVVVVDSGVAWTFVGAVDAPMVAADGALSSAIRIAPGGHGSVTSLDLGSSSNDISVRPGVRYISFTRPV
jgi:hypothetical protein